MALLEVRDLKTTFYTEDGLVKAVDGVSYDIERGERFGIVGESGAGKSAASLSLMRLIQDPGRIESGTIRFKGEDILEMSDKRLRQLRGGEISMIFQEPQTALNPVFTIGEQISEAIRTHMDYGEVGARDRAISLLEDVGIPDAASRYDDYPHQFSGGMQQRAVIAIALSCDPDLIIADEPTTALDVTIEAQILDLLRELGDEYDTAIQLITHDLAVVADMCDRVMVMYAGKAVEKAPAEDLYYNPSHPYTVGLMSSIPRIGEDRERLATIPGTMPDLVEVPPGCSFHPRCPYAEDICTEKQPELVDVETGEVYEERVEGESAETRPEPDPQSHVASCLAYSGDLSGDLDFDVSVEGDRRERFQADGGIETAASPPPDAADTAGPDNEGTETPEDDS